MNEKTGVFKPIVRSSGDFVAGIAAIPGGRARFFIVQITESTDAFIGRVSTWIKGQGATGLAMEQPDVLADGADAEVMLRRLRISLGAPPEGNEAEFDVANVVLTPGQATETVH